MDRHIVMPEVFELKHLTDGQVLPTVGGEDITVSVADNGGITLTSVDGYQAAIVKGDISSCSGVMHKVDRVLAP